MDPSCLQGWELIPVGNARGEPGGYRIFLALFYMANENPERADTYPEPPMSDGEPRTGTQYRALSITIAASQLWLFASLPRGQ